MTSKVVLATTSGYDYNEIEPFISTFNVNSDAKLIVFGIHNDLKLIKSVEASGAVYIDCTSRFQPCNDSLVSIFRTLRTTRGLRKYFHRLFSIAGKNPRLGMSLETYFCGLQSQRYSIYRDWLYEQSCSEVIICDIRDVVFQTNPFSKPIQNLEIAVEPMIRVQPGEHNHTWLTSAYGKEISDSYIGNRVSCSGVSAGPKNQLLSYFDLMSSEITRLRGFVGPIDQAVHNHLWYTGQLCSHVALENGEARVITLQYEDMDRVTQLGKHLLFDDTLLVPIIHQYDRHRKTTDFVRDVLLK